MARSSLLPLLPLIAACAGTPPALPTLAITPAEPTTVDDLVAIIGATQDRRGEPLTHTLVWRVRGDIAPIDGATVPASATAKGQLWVASLTVTDGSDEVGTVDAQVRIRNTPPVALGAAIAPARPTSQDPLTCTSIGEEDVDGDAVALGFAWTVGGVVMSDDPVLGPAAFIKGQEVTCTVTPRDDEEEGEPVHAQVTIANSPPSAPAIALVPQAPVATVDALHCEITSPAIDPDRDPVSYSFTWTVDGAPYPSATPQATGPTTTTLTGDTIPAADTVLGALWTCAVVADDGEDESPRVTASVEVTPLCANLVVGALPGWGAGWTDSRVRWSAMLDRQESYGDCRLSFVDIAHGFTLDTLLDAGVDVVLLPNVAGGSTTFTDLEQAAIQAYIDGGHGGAVATYLLRFTVYGWRDAAAIFGVDPGVLVNELIAADTRVDVREVGHELMAGLEVRSFNAGGHPFAQRTSRPLADALLADTTIVANNGAAAVIAHEGAHRGVWITWMVEFQSTTDDGLRLIYNSLVWAAGFAP